MNPVKLVYIVTIFALNAQIASAQMGQTEKLETAVSKIHTEVIDARSVTTIRLSNSLHARDVDLRYADIANPTVSIEVLAPQNKPERLGELLRSVTFALNTGTRTVEVQSGLMIYSCSYRATSINGRVTREVSGSCFGPSISVVLPNKSDVAVWLGSKPLNSVARENVTASTLIQMIKAESFDDKKLETLNKILSTKKDFMFKPDEASAIVIAFTHMSSKKDVAIQIGSRVPKANRLEFYALIEKSLGHFDKQDVLQALDKLP